MSNAAYGYLGDYLPHKPKCSCADCLLERTQQKLAAAEAREKGLQDKNASLRAEVESLKEDMEFLGKNISSFEQQVKSLRAQLAEATKPLTQEDVFAFSLDTLDPKESIPLLLAARAAKGGE